MRGGGADGTGAGAAARACGIRLLSAAAVLGCVLSAAAPAAGATGTGVAPPTALGVVGAFSCAGTDWVTTSTPTLRATPDDPGSGTTGVGFRVDADPSVRATETPVPANPPGAPVEWAVDTSGNTTDTAPLADGTYDFSARDVQSSGSTQASSYWSPASKFTIDTTPPAQPQVSSFDYPEGNYGLPATHRGTFTLTGSADTVAFAYTFIGSGDEHLPGDADCDDYDNPAAEWVPAVDGHATLTVPTGLSGREDLYVVAFDAAHVDSPESAAYPFYVPRGYTGEGTTSPLASTLVWKATDPTDDCAFTQTGQPIWPHGTQERLMADAPGASFTTSFRTRVHAYDALGVAVTTGPDYGTLSFDLDGTPIDGQDGAPLTFDATSPTLSTAYVSLAGVDLAAGLHRLTVTIGGPAGTGATTAACGQASYDDNGYSAGITSLTAVPINDVTYPGLRAAMDDHGIAEDGAVPASLEPCPCRYALSQTALTGAGFGPGEQVDVAGVTYTMPAYRHAGTGSQLDDVIASGQTIDLPRSASPANYVDLLVAATCVDTTDHVTQVSPAVAFTLNFADGHYSDALLPATPDWIQGDPSDAMGADGSLITTAVTMGYLDEGPTATPDDAYTPSLYQLQLPTGYSSGDSDGRVSSITLPELGSVQGDSCSTTALHVFAITTS